MEWTETLRRTIGYLEAHLLEEDAAEGAAREACLSPLYLQKGFKLVTGYSMTEYIRNRRLYLAGLEIIAGREKVIDLAYQYGYDTPESFSKAFSRFHGVSPSQLRRSPDRLAPFLPLRITLSIRGGHDMDFTVEKMEGLQFIGIEREFPLESSYRDLPRFWDEFAHTHCSPLQAGKEPETALEKAVCQCNIGEFGVCIDTGGSAPGHFRYMIAGRYDGREIPEGLTVFTLPALEWARFRCSGPMPEALQAVNTKIFREWLPGNPDYEIALGVNIEWYSMDKTMDAADYESEIWLPVRRKRPC